MIASSGFNPILLVTDSQADTLALAKHRVPTLPVDAVTSDVSPAGKRRF